MIPVLTVTENTLPKAWEASLEALLSMGCDIYVAFIEKGLNFINYRGILTYIVPNKFFGADYGKKIRTIRKN